jgi:hypothetical protein
MKRDDVVLANEFCGYHNIELSFIHSLEKHGMIETIVSEEKIYLPVSALDRLEKIIRLHVELDINIEGIETITYLLDRMQTMQEQITQLTNRLKAYER